MLGKAVLEDDANTAKSARLVQVSLLEGFSRHHHLIKIHCHNDRQTHHHQSHHSFDHNDLNIVLFIIILWQEEMELTLVGLQVNVKMTTTIVMMVVVVMAKMMMMMVMNVNE